jgi:hypothetical protein
VAGLDDYELQGQIGSGASGTVWRAVRRGPVPQTVAVKRLRTSAATDENVMRLRREAMVLAELDHPHIVRVLDVVEDGHGVAICMPFAPGGSLEALLAQRGRLAPGEVVAVAVPIAEALGSAHRRGILHVDVKPANILFTSDGEPLLGDFGVARTLGRLTGALGAGSPLAGTAHYLAPELLDGADPDPRCDVYSLAVVCYEALTGKRPYDAAMPLAILRKADTGAHEPLTGRPDVPPAVATVVEQAMARDPDRRVASADMLARALRDALPSSEIGLPGTVATHAIHTPAEIVGAGDPGTSTAPTAAMGTTTAPAPAAGDGITIDLRDRDADRGAAADDWEHTRPFGPRPPAYAPPPPPQPGPFARLVATVGRGFRATGRLFAGAGTGVGQAARTGPGRLVTAIGSTVGRGPLLIRIVVAVVLVAGVGLAYLAASRSDSGRDCPEVEEPVADVGAQVVRGDPEGDGCLTYGVYELATQATSKEDMLLTIRVEGQRRRVRLGELGDRLFLGDWDCDATDTPAVYRWGRGELHYYDDWRITGTGEDQPDEIEPTHPRGRASLTRDRDGIPSSGDRCDRIEVEPIGNG